MATLDAGYFALVMATGIISVGIGDHGMAILSGLLLWIAATSYIVLIILTGWRAIAFPAGLRADLADPQRGFGFFTFVAGTNILGTRLSAAGEHRPALVLLAIGCLGWLLLGYLIPWTVILGQADRPGFLYAAIGVLVAARFLLHPLRPDDLTPPYWVAMGATAITVLAGSRIVRMADAPMSTPPAD